MISKEIIDQELFKIGFVCIKLIIILIIFQIIMQVLKYVLRSIIKTRLKNSSSARIATLCSISDDFLKYTVNSIMIIAWIYQFGVSSSVILGSIGIFSVVIGLAAQSLLNDFINGIFTVVEGYYDVGDFVKIGEYEGTVTSLGIKSTGLVDGNNRTVTIPNSKIDEIVNYSKTQNHIYVEYIFDYSNSFEVIEAEFEKLELCETTYNNKYLGISKVESVGYKLIIEVKCTAMERFQAQRELNLIILKIINKNSLVMHKCFMGNLGE
jgi:small conductance mechanosensitive channel